MAALTDQEIEKIRELLASTLRCPPCNSLRGGILTIGAQDIQGVKTFLATPVISGLPVTSLAVGTADQVLTTTTGIATWKKLEAANVSSAANGICPLDGSAKVPAAYLPNSVMDYLGAWSVVTNTPTLADGSGNAGDTYRASDAGDRDLGSGSQHWEAGDFVIYNGSVWQHSPSGAIPPLSASRPVVTTAAGLLSTPASLLAPEMGGVPPGAVMMFGGSSAPTGWLLCDGASLVRADYAALFAVLGTAFGAVDGTHFSLPDYRGVFPKGAGTTTRAAGKDANANYYAATLGTYSLDRFQGHKHNVTGTSTTESRGHTHTVTAGYASGGSNYASASTNINNDYTPRSFSVTQGASQTHTHDVNVDSAVPKTDGTNGTPRTGVTTEPQSLGINFIIKY